MKFGALLEFDDPSALNRNFNRGEWCFGRGSWLCALQRIKLRSVAWADQLLLAFVVGHGAALMGADRRIGEDSGLRAKENRRNALLGSGEVVGSTDLELRGSDDVGRCGGSGFFREER